MFDGYSGALRSCVLVKDTERLYLTSSGAAQWIKASVYNRKLTWALHRSAHHGRDTLN